MRRTIPFILAVGSLAALGASPEPAASRFVVGHLADIGRWTAFEGMEGAVLLSPGGALASSDEALRTGGRFAADAVKSLGFVAVNVSADDLRLGAGAVTELVASGPFVSANLSDTAGKPLARPFVVHKAGTVRLGIAGVAFPPPGDAPPYLADVKIADPSVMLRAVAKPIETLSDLRILLVHGDPRDAAKLLREHPAFQIAIVAGGVSPDARPIEIGGGRLLLSPSGGDVCMTHEVAITPGVGIRRSVRGMEGSRVASGVRRGPAPAGAGPLEAVYAKHALSANPAEAIARAQEEKGPARDREEDVLPERLEPGATVAMIRSGANRAVRLTVGSLRLTESYGALRATAGESFLVLSTEWENIIPLTFVRERQVPTEYKIPALADHAYLVVDGKRVARILDEAEGLPGHIPVKDFRLERIGTRIRGNLVFRVRAGAVEDLALRFYDFAHGFIVLPVAGRRDVAAPAGAAAIAKNEVVELSVYAFRKSAERGAAKAPEGKVFVEVDLRGRSLFTLRTDASAFDPAAKKGATIAVGTVADWKESRRYLQLVVDGEYACAPLAESTLPEEPRFLPDLPAGGDIVFLAPEKAASLALRCDFPNAKAPGSEKTIRPKGIDIPLEGERPAIADRLAAVSVEDDVLATRVEDPRRVEILAGEAAGEGFAFLLIDVTAFNRGKGGEFYQPLAQLKYVTEAGEEIEADPRCLGLLHPPIPILWIPAGERRAFSLAYRIPAKDRRPRLAYSGVSLAKVLALPPFEALVAVVPPKKVEAPKKVEPPKEAEPAKKTAPPKKTEPSPVAPPVAPEPATPLVARGLAGVGLTAEEVNRAIDRGAEFLWRHIQTNDLTSRDGPFGHDEEHVLAALALVHADAHRKFPEFDAAVRGLIERFDPVDEGTYQAGIMAMIIRGLGDPSYHPALRRCARYLIEAQGPKGMWNYTAQVPDEAFGIPGGGPVLEVSGGRPLDGSGPQGAPLDRMTDVKIGSDGDNSVSQYAILGLQAISRSGLRLAPEIWKRSADTFAGRQDRRDGGWGYTTGAGYGSMTCAGVCSLAICLNELGEEASGKDPRVAKGLAWLAANFSIEKHPKHDTWFFYYLYSLERVGRILGLEFLGTREWYPLGAKHLLSIQREDGGWVGEGEEKDPRLATSFALLFLTRATETLPGEEKRGGNGVLRTGVAHVRARKFYFILDASGSMLAEMAGRTKFDIARDAVSSIVGEMPDSGEVALRVYGHRKRSIEEGANEDTVLEIPLGPLAKDEFREKLASLRARGKTPLARSLREAARDLASAGEVTVVLLTDGGEDTMPRQDPLAAAEEIGKLKAIALHVIGFDIGREDWSVQLREISARARGRYWPAAEARSLERELRRAVFGTPDRFSVYDCAGAEVAKGAFGESRTLPEGKYRLRAWIGDAGYDEAFWINTDAVTSVVFHADRIASGSAPPPAIAPPPAKEPPRKPEPKVPPRFCTNCGQALKPDARFCTNCGKKVGE